MNKPNFSDFIRLVASVCEIPGSDFTWSTKHSLVGSLISHVIMMAEKSKICMLPTGNPGELMVSIQPNSEGLRTKRADVVSSSLSLSPKAGEDWCPAWKQLKRKNSFLLSLLSFSGLQWVGWSPCMIEGVVCFTPFTDLNVNLIQKHLCRHTQK